MGTVYELSPPAQGQTTWTGTVLWAFVDRQGGADPRSNLIADAAGNLYGVTVFGGSNDHGVVFELSPPAAGQTLWTETVLHTFAGKDGSNPSYGGLIADAAGNLYGTTGKGGANNDGVVFRLSPPLPGKTAWTETVLYAFSGPDGSTPEASLLADGAGNLYGTAIAGGANGLGVAFELSPPKPGQSAWTEKILASFDGTHGATPFSALISDGARGFYGTTVVGGRSDDGVVFQIKS